MAIVEVCMVYGNVAYPDSGCFSPSLLPGRCHFLVTLMIKPPSWSWRGNGHGNRTPLMQLAFLQRPRSRRSLCSAGIVKVRSGRKPMSSSSVLKISFALVCVLTTHELAYYGNADKTGFYGEWKS